MGKMVRNDKLNVNLAASVRQQVASNLSAYLSCVSLDGPLPPPGIFLQPWARNEKNNTRSEISQVIHALGAEKEDAARDVNIADSIQGGEARQLAAAVGGARREGQQRAGRHAAGGSGVGVGARVRVRSGAPASICGSWRRREAVDVTRMDEILSVP